MYQHIRTTAGAGFLLRHILGNCKNCRSDMVGVSEFQPGKWRAFCTDCEHCVEGGRDELIATWASEVAYAA